jgi:hypothetical protein
MKQTAVEWLHNQLHLNISLYQDEWQIIEGLMEEAKEREKEQLILFGVQCMIEVEKESGLGAIRIYELYYNKTFNKSINDKG